MIFCLFAITFYGRLHASPLIPQNAEFIQRGFTENAAFEESNPRVG